MPSATRSPAGACSPRGTGAWPTASSASSPAWLRCTWPASCNGSLRDRAIGGAVAGSIAVIVGFLFIFTDNILQGMDIATIFSTLYVPVVIGDLIGTIILVPILVYAWEPVKERLGR